MPDPATSHVHLVILTRRAVLPTGVAEAAIAIQGERIAAVTSQADALAADETLDVGERAVLPGVVDSHVHVNEPGRTEWEGFASATRAAAAGGVTTLVDMPLNSVPPTTTTAGLSAKREAARALMVDVAFWGGVVPGNLAELEPLAAAGVAGFKCFLAPSGVPEFEHVGEDHLLPAMRVLSRIGLPLLAHAESPAMLDHAAAASGGRDPRSHGTWLASRPEEAEVEAVRLLAGLAERTRCRIHVVHVASAAALAEVAGARARGVAITAETCPHYLTFVAEEIPERATTFKCAPPIRERRHREALWQGLRDGTIDQIVSDHSPCPPAMKRLEDGDFLAAWGGIASLELALAASWTGARARGMGLEWLVRWMSEAPARLAGLADRKGRIEAGCDADLVVFDPEASWRVEASRLHHRHPVTPYQGCHLHGRVEATFVRGENVYREGKFAAAPPGRTLVPRLDRPAPPH